VSWKSSIIKNYTRQVLFEEIFSFIRAMKTCFISGVWKSKVTKKLICKVFASFLIGIVTLLRSKGTILSADTGSQADKSNSLSGESEMKTLEQSFRQNSAGFAWSNY
jgi:hypothetical protein